MPEELESFPFDQPKPAGKKPRRKKAKPNRGSGAPVEEIDALAPATAEIGEEEPPVEEPSEEAAESEPEAFEESEPVGHDFDALPSAPAPREQTPWEEFLALCPRDVLQVIYDCGLFTLEKLLAHSPETLLYPVGQFNRVQVHQVQILLQRFGWQLSDYVPPAVAKLPPRDSSVVKAVVSDQPAAFQHKRHIAARKGRATL